MIEAEVLAALKGLTVLLVEDDALVSVLVEEYLQDWGCNLAGVAFRLDDAIEMAEKLTFDVALLDINLGGQASYPVAEVLRGRKIPFLFMTGYDPWGHPGRVSGSIVLRKPFSFSQLASSLRDVCLIASAGTTKLRCSALD